MIDAHEWYADGGYSSTGTELDKLVDQTYPNPLENETTHLVCPNCGENLYDGDTHYPRLGLCECCLSDYRERVEIR